MKKLKANFKGIVDELGFSKGQVKLTIGFCIASAGLGALGTLWDAGLTILVFGVVVLAWSIMMFDINFRGIPNEEFKRHDNK